MCDVTIDREKDALLGGLEGQRRHVLAMLEGLSDEQLRTAMLPSGWHCLGLVRHLTGVEDYWFRQSVNGEPSVASVQGEGDDWTVPEHQRPQEILDRYRSAVARSNEIIAATPLDAPPRQPDAEWQEWGMSFPDLRTILVHVLIDTSVHAGHLDATRELIDGRQWVVI
jgi:hypothetical protein